MIRTNIVRFFSPGCVLAITFACVPHQAHAQMRCDPRRAAYCQQSVMNPCIQRCQRQEGGTPGHKVCAWICCRWWVGCLPSNCLNQPVNCGTP
jgi:hypothetical protein